MQDIPVLAWIFHVLKSALYPENKTDLLLAICDKQYGEGWTQKRAEKELAKTRENQMSEELDREKWPLHWRIQSLEKSLPECTSVQKMTGILPDLLALQMPDPANQRSL